MKTINQYLDLCKQKFEDDHEYTNISKKESVDFIIDNAFFDGDCRYNSFLFTGKVSGLPCHCIEL
jgi:hypothetical protein